VTDIKKKELASAETSSTGTSGRNGGGCNDGVRCIS